MYETRWATFSELSVIVNYWKMMTNEMTERDNIPQLDIRMAEKVERLFINETESGNLKFRVAVDESDSIVACAGGLIRMEYAYPLAEKQSPFGWIISVYTSRNYRNHGLANKLVDEVCFWLKEKGAKRARLWSSHSGKRIYEGLGFKNMIDMTKSLV
ncbi:MAG: GNAT family N-acetyltransferase [Eubacteriales bacterium]